MTVETGIRRHDDHLYFKIHVPLICLEYLSLLFQTNASIPYLLSGTAMDRPLFIVSIIHCQNNRIAVSANGSEIPSFDLDLIITFESISTILLYCARRSCHSLTISLMTLVFFKPKSKQSPANSLYLNSVLRNK